MSEVEAFEHYKKTVQKTLVSRQDFYAGYRAGIASHQTKPAPTVSTAKAEAK